MSISLAPRTALPVRIHWLVGAADKAGLSGALSARTPAGISLADAWDLVARSAGVSVKDLAAAVAPSLRMGLANLDTANATSLRLVPERLARKHRAFPVGEDDRTIVVAIADPFDHDAEQEIAFAAGRRVRFEICPPHLIDEAIAAEYSPDRAVEALLGSAITAQAAADLKVLGEESIAASAASAAGTGPVVELTNHIICAAVRQGASDIHIEPGPRSATIRFRIDGVMRHHMHTPLAVIVRVVSRIKVMAKLDIADRMRPQDGRSRVEIDGSPIDLRVSTVPTRAAEKAVIRLLRPDSNQTLAQLGIPAIQLQRLRTLIRQRDGIVIVTGPTGSGKTTTLYAAIREMNDGNVNIMTVEDPIEYEVAGITQMQVETKRGVTFATSLRAILRQDPDVIFVGEIRDLETAVIAVQASMTGHLVLATLHANDAMSAVARLMDLGLDSAKIAATFRGSIAQRLVRRVCPDCAFRIDGTPSAEEERLAQRFGIAAVVRAIGCARCHNTGYRGRIPVDEIAMVTPEIEALIAANAPSSALQRGAMDAGMLTLREVALTIAAAGDTTLAEVSRVLGESDDDPRESKPEVPATPLTLLTPTERTVLVVDDDPVHRLLCERILRQNGYAVVTARDGIDGMEALDLHPEVDLILTDLHMPRLDGAGLISRVRAGSETTSTPIVVLTGSSGEGNEEISVMDLGADDYLRKPVDPPRLIARVRAALRRSGTPDPSRQP
jgi:type II secretory ATPase GspE/PulE/Tfp pilus assembly ATPase PilB-like protein/CheY-like chemotaxis protein